MLIKIVSCQNVSASPIHLNSLATKNNLNEFMGTTPLNSTNHQVGYKYKLIIK